ncbi:hypothetical protein HMI55_004756 [Coelomomyces lativittatus]|nr:hypothetical protein HMI55_004756 [Coelomomyces lativittatus]
MALSFAEVWKSKDTDFEEAYYEFCIWANLRRKVEYKSAVLIQRTWRKHALKKWLDFLSQQAIQIQKVIRGYLARKHLRNQLEGEWHDALNKYYHFNATQIQRSPTKFVVNLNYLKSNNVIVIVH